MTQQLGAVNKKISFYESKRHSRTNHLRKADTRHKIQLGGLVIKSGLADFFSISAGADLQLDEQEREKATLLLGALIEMTQNFSSLDLQKERWALLGQSAFAEHFLTSKSLRK